MCTDSHLNPALCWPAVIQHSFGIQLLKTVSLHFFLVMKNPILYLETCQKMFWIKWDFPKAHKFFSKSECPFTRSAANFSSLDFKQDLVTYSAWSMTACLHVFVYHMLLYNKHFSFSVLNSALLSLNNLGISDTPLSPRMHFQRVNKHSSPTETDTLDWSALSR